MSKSQNYACPFCNKTGFDLVGFKIHLQRGDCAEYAKLDTALPKSRCTTPEQTAAKNWAQRHCERTGCRFMVAVFKLNAGQVPTDDLKDNATFVKLRDAWLFEGDWDIFVDPDTVTFLGEIAVPSLGGLTDERLAAVYDLCGGRSK